MVVHQVVSETTPYQIQKKFYILGKFLLRKSYSQSNNCRCGEFGNFRWCYNIFRCGCKIKYGS